MLLRAWTVIVTGHCYDIPRKSALKRSFFGWVMVRAEALYAKAVLHSALCAGDFYVSQFPHSANAMRERPLAASQMHPREEIHIITYPPRGKAVYALDKPLTELDYPLKGAETYVRVECIDHEGRTAWSQSGFGM
ncbi:MAG: hypothetical protein ACLVB5_02530 [Christensenellales bacterium]